MNKQEILNKYNELVKGHLSAKKALINLVHRSKVRHHQKWILGENNLVDHSKCLLVGGSGTGKTFLVDTLHSLINFPLIKIDATKLTITGATGGMKNNELSDMIRKNAEHLVSLKNGYYHSVEGTIEQTVVFIDELDKLAWGSNEGDHWNKRVQSNFLRIFEEEPVSFVFAGAFASSEKQTASIGFFNKTVQKDSLDIVKYGLIPELVGRINNIIELDKFTREDFRDILVTKLIPKKAADLLKINQTVLEITESQIEKILDKSMESGQGVRFMKRELEELLVDIEFNQCTV